MKNLDRMNNVEKARLLHQLFPQEIPALIEFVQGMSHAIIVDEPTHREQWNLRLMTFDLWLHLTKQADEKILHYGKKLNTNSRLFADQLFDGYMAIFIAHCLTAYCETAKNVNPKFSAAINLFF